MFTKALEKLELLHNVRWNVFLQNISYLKESQRKSNLMVIEDNFRKRIIFWNAESYLFLSVTLDKLAFSAVVLALDE